MIAQQASDAADNRYWAWSVLGLLSRLGTRREGLSEEEATVRLARFGPNAPARPRRAGPLWTLLRQYRSPLVLILLFGAIVSIAVNDWLDALIILLIVFGSTLLSFAQENRASRALEQLRSRLSLRVSVMRDGQPCQRPITEVVPGDVLQLSAGDLVPADGVVLEANDLQVAEAALTGEAFPVEKRAGAVAADCPVPARVNCLYQGTSVRSGSGLMVAVHTGAGTRFGEIAHQLERRAPETDFQRGIRHFGYLLTQVMAVMTVGVFVGNLLLDRPVVDALLFAVALAVGLSPELLPVIVTVTLSAGARRMAERGVLVRRLESIDNLGSMTVLCTDKTGTLTDGVMRVDSARAPSGASDAQVLRWAALNATLQSGMRNPLDDAIVAARADADATAFAKVAEIPYDFVRRRLTVVARPVGGDPRDLIVTKGAMANVLDCCTQVAEGSARTVLDETTRQAIEARFEAWSAEGFRVLGLAVRETATQAAYGHNDERDMAFAGFLLFSDPPKADASATVRDLAAAGVTIKVLTGDNRFIAAHVATAVGLPAGAVLAGADIDRLDNAALTHLAPRTDLFVEMDPNQKERIIRCLQRSGAVVGYLGDGINDAPALHVADVGISVDQAVDVARESADLVLLEHDLDVLRAGIAEGRRTIANTLKYIRISASANFGNMISMALASLLLPFLPLLARQILLNNFLADFPSIAIAGDRVDPELTAQPFHWDIRELRIFMIVFGVVSSVFDVLTFLVLLFVFHSGSGLFRTGWFVESLLTQLAVLLVVRTRRAFFRSAPGRVLLVLTLGMAALAIALPYIGVVAVPFEFEPLPVAVLGVLLAITAAYVAATEFVKYRFYRRPHASRMRTS